MLEDSSNDDVAAAGTNGGAAHNASRRKRTSFSRDHVELLRATFKTDPYPGISVRERLSQQTGIPESRIQVGVVSEPKARTLKGGGVKKTLSNTATHDTFSLPVSNEGPQGPPPAYQTQMGNSFYYEQSPPPVCQNSPNHRQCSAMFAPQGSLAGVMSSMPMRSYWPQQGHSQAPPVTPFYCQPPPDLNTSSTPSTATFVYPGPVDPQVYWTLDVTPPFNLLTPDTGLGDNSFQSSTKKYSRDSSLDNLWSNIAQDNWSAQWGPQERDHRAENPPLPDLSLSDVLEVLKKDLMEEELKKVRFS